MTDTINLNGHQIPVDRADEFFHASTGATLSDAEWDEQQRRLEANNIALVPPEFR